MHFYLLVDWGFGITKYNYLGFEVCSSSDKNHFYGPKAIPVLTIKYYYKLIVVVKNKLPKVLF